MPQRHQLLFYHFLGCLEFLTFNGKFWGKFSEAYNGDRDWMQVMAAVIGREDMKLVVLLVLTL